MIKMLKLLLFAIVFAVVLFPSFASISGFGDLSPDNTITGGTDYSLIGNIGDRLKVHATNSNDDPIHIEFQEYHHDVYGDFTTVTPLPVFEYHFRFDTSDGIYWDSSITGAATDSQDTDKQARKLTTTTAINDKVIKSTRRYISFFRGKSQKSKIVFIGHTPTSGLVQEYGLFDDKNGFMLRIDGTTPKFVIRSSSTGSVTEVLNVSQSLWNIDKLDGTGSSGYNIDFSKVQTMIIEFGECGARFGFLYNGHPLYAHSYCSINQLDYPFVQTGTLPIRFTLENTTAQASSRSIYLISADVSSKGGTMPLGILRTLDTGANEVTVSKTQQPIMMIRLDPNTNRAAIRPIDFNLVATSGNSEVYWEIYLNPTITGTPTWVDTPASLTEYVSNASTLTVSGGYKLDGGYVQVGKDTQYNSFLSNVFMGRAIDGTSDILVLVARTLNSTSKLLMAGRWREFP